MILRFYRIFKRYAGCIQKIEEYNSGKKRKILIVFDDMIADMINNKETKLNSNRIIY